MHTEQLLCQLCFDAKWFSLPNLALFRFRSLRNGNKLLCILSREGIYWMIAILDKAQDYPLQYLTAAFAKGWYQTSNNQRVWLSSLPVFCIMSKITIREFRLYQCKNLAWLQWCESSEPSLQRTNQRRSIISMLTSIQLEMTTPHERIWDNKPSRSIQLHLPLLYQN